MAASLLLNSCYFFMPKKIKSTNSSEAFSGETLGNKASSGPIVADIEALALVNHAVAPAPVRPDPDQYAKLLLLMFHSNDVGVARQLGRVEQYRLLLGGATEDFSTMPQNTYDATSLLAKMKVVEDICSSLINPVSWIHGDWQSILPYQASETDQNISFLSSRLLGTTTSDLSSEDLAILNEILVLGKNTDDEFSVEHYVPVCSAILMNSEILYF